MMRTHYLGNSLVLLFYSLPTGAKMKNTKEPCICFALLIFSGLASAGVPTTTISQDFDIGTLTSTPYATSFNAERNDLVNSYTFDLATSAFVDMTLFNPRYDRGDLYIGIPPVTHTAYDINLFDSQDHLLYAGTTTERWDYGSTKVMHIAGFVQSGENYYLRVAGVQNNDTALAYQVQLVAASVPELESYAMFMAGLGLLGWRLRKLKKE
jgi:hypothetical protein